MDAENSGGFQRRASPAFRLWVIQKGREHPCWHRVSKGKQRCPWQGYPKGTASTLAHDFALQSLVCYTFASGANAGFLRSKIRLAGKGSEGIYSPRPAAATLLFQRFFRFPLPWVMAVFPRWLMGLFMCLDFLRIPIRETNSSFVSVS